MKRIIIVLLAISILFAACGYSQPIPSATKEAPERETLDEKTTSYLKKLIESSTDTYTLDVNIHQNEECAASVSVHMDAYPTGFSFCDILYETMVACNSVIAEFDYPISEIYIYVGYEDSYFCWQSTNLDDGIFVDSCKSYIKKMTMDDIFSYFSFSPIN